MNKSRHFVHLSDRGKGILMSIVGVFVLSPDSLLIRLAGLDDYTLIFYRGLFPIISISLILWFHYRSDFIPALLRIGWAGVLNGFLFAAVNISFIGAIQRTTVANTLLFLSSAPIFAAPTSATGFATGDCWMNGSWFRPKRSSSMSGREGSMGASQSAGIAGSIIVSVVNTGTRAAIP